MIEKKLIYNFPMLYSNNKNIEFIEWNDRNITVFTAAYRMVEGHKNVYMTLNDLLKDFYLNVRNILAM